MHKGTNRKQFVVDPARDVWKCFSPHHNAGGGVLEFVAEFENVTKREAEVLIAGWFAIAPIQRRVERRPKMAGDRPSHKAFVVEERGEGEEAGFWTRIGSAWPHKDSKGLNIVLSALPTNGRIVLREYTDEDAAEDDKKAVTNKSKRK